MNRRLVMAIAGLFLIGVTLVSATSPCTGGVFGGRRLVDCCKSHAEEDCDTTTTPAKPHYWERTACDIWCCPGETKYIFNNCHMPWEETGTCCTEADKDKCLLTNNGQPDPSCLLDPP